MPDTIAPFANEFIFPENPFIGQAVQGPTGAIWWWDGTKWIGGTAGPITPFLPISGGTLTGPLYLWENPVSNMEAATKEYVDENDAFILNKILPEAPMDGQTYGRSLAGWHPVLPRTGGVMLGNINMANWWTVTGIPTPVNPSDAVPLSYLDDFLTTGLQYRGIWQVAANVPNLITEAAVPPANGDYWLAVTADPGVPEQAPPGVPGIAGLDIRNGSMVVWVAEFNGYQVMPSGNLTVDLANQLYLQLSGGRMTGPIILSGPATTDLEPVTLEQFNNALLGYFPLTGGTLTGSIFMAPGTTIVMPAGYTPTNPSDIVTLGSLEQTLLQYTPVYVGVSPPAPANTYDGDLWWDSVGGNLYVWYVDVDGGQWVIANAAETGPAGQNGPPGPPGPPGAPGPIYNFLGSVADQSDLPPTGNNPGDAYFVESTQTIWLWNGTEWVNAGPIQGVPGPTGPIGPIGATGPQGPAGNQGPQGPPGNQGPQGVTGPQGVAGADGPEGPPGPQGVEGPQGAPGLGFNIVGSVPTSSDLPPTGANNGDAYVTEDTGNIWVWTGTEWVDLGNVEGPQGPQGIQGPPGADGPPGQQGVQGQPGVEGPAGPQGPPGPEGAVGPAGPQGVPGQGLNFLGTVDTAADLPASGNTNDMYVAADTGQGYIWDGTTWVPAGTMQGPPGPEGPQGPAGSGASVGDTPPTTPSTGDMWFNTATGELNVWDGTTWQVVSGAGGGGGTSPGPTPPASPNPGDLWYDTANNVLNVWNGTAWVPVSGDYLPLAGGTLTGPLLVNPSAGGSAQGQLTVGGMGINYSLTGSVGQNIAFAFSGNQPYIYVNGIAWGPLITQNVGNTTYLRLTGDMMLGPITLAGNAVQPMQPVTLQQFNAGLATAGDVTQGSVPPGAPSTGMLWWDTVGAQLYIWDGAQWVITVNPPSSGGGVDAADLVSTQAGNQIGLGSDGNLYVSPALTGSTVPIAFSYTGKPGALALVTVPAAIAMNVAANLAGAQAFATAAPSAAAVFTLMNLTSAGANIADLGTITFAAGAHVGTFAGPGGAVAVGTVLQMEAPGTQDATLSDCGITILFTRA